MLSLSRIVKRWQTRQKEKELISFLRAKQTKEIPHYKKSLFTHLSNTYSTLKKWECEPDVCFAGLFHSIYGTQIFRHQTVSYDERERVRRMIGPHSEDLVYLFSACDRPKGLVQALETGNLLNIVTNQYTPINPIELSDLLLIECANLRDQESAENWCMEVLKKIEELSFPASPFLNQVLRNTISEARTH